MWPLLGNSCRGRLQESGRQGIQGGRGRGMVERQTVSRSRPTSRRTGSHHSCAHSTVSPLTSDGSVPNTTPGTDNRVLQVCQLLNEHGVRYILAGGVAANLHGSVRDTRVACCTVTASHHGCIVPLSCQTGPSSNYSMPTFDLPVARILASAAQRTYRTHGHLGRRDTPFRSRRAIRSWSPAAPSPSLSSPRRQAAGM